MEKKKNKIDYFDDVSFHPSLDIKNNILVLGFRIKPELDKEKQIFLVVSKKHLQITESSSFEIDNDTYQIEMKGRRLSKLSKQWNWCDFQDTYEHLSKEWKPMIKPLEVFNGLKKLLQVHIDLDDQDCTLLVAWSIGTYFFPIFSAYPYLHIKAPKGSGKSQCLGFLNQVCLNATKARASLPALRDTVDSLRGTYLMDQADALHRNNMEDLLDILTDSYKRGGGDVRKMVADKGKNWNLEEFQAYSPKAFASIYQLPEDLRDRCILIALTRSKKNFKPLDEEDSVWKETRGNIYKLLISVFADVIHDYEFKKIEYRLTPAVLGRQLELWLPLEVLMTVIGVSKEEQNLARQKFESRYGFTESQVNDLEKSVIEVLLEELLDKAEVILSPKEIVEKLDDSVFGDEDDFWSVKKKSVQVGRTINKFNLSSKKLPRSNKGERYLFEIEQVKKVSKGYLTEETEDEHTQTYTEQNELIKQEDF